jgi:hypothetical protein
MAALTQGPAAAAASILGGKGKALQTHEMHIRPTANKGFIVKHDLRDKEGRHPVDGQRDSAEYHMNNPAELAKHVSAVAPTMGGPNPNPETVPEPEPEPGS